jgi:hypothetical protein
MLSDPRAVYDAITAELALSAGVTPGQMFGMPCLKAGSKAFAGFYHGDMVFKLGTPTHAEALALADAHLFDPSGRGRPMKEWVVVPAEHASQWAALADVARRYVE